MRFTVLIPHFKVGKMIAYSVAQFLKHKGKHEIDIIVIDNSYPDESINYLKPFEGQIKIIHNTSDKISSHGIAYDMAMPHVETEWVVTAESDSFPTASTWLDYYEFLIDAGYDGAGSLLTLSGGSYIHPAGALYRKSIWEQAKKYCDECNYFYFPNMAMKEGFACHLMLHINIVNDVLLQPEKFIELSDEYKPYHPLKAEQKNVHYSPVVGPFHNGMGSLRESIKTYSQRTVVSDSPRVLLDGKESIIERIGYEPGQWLCYYQFAKGKKIYAVPTQVKWLPNREGQQQEYSLMENGFKHLWAISAYHSFDGGPELQDIITVKRNAPNVLYDTLPEAQKIPT